MKQPLMTLTLLVLFGCGGTSGLRGDTMTEPADDGLDGVMDPVADPFSEGVDTAGWECIEDLDCNDGEPCTRDLCDPDLHECVHEAIVGPAYMGPDIQVTDDPNFSMTRGGIIWTGSDAGILWQDGRDGPCPDMPGPTFCNYEAYFKRVNVSGEELSSDERLSHNEAECWPEGGVWTGSEYGITWTCGNFFESQAFFGRVGGDGSPEGDEIALSGLAGGLRSSSLAWTGSEFGVLYTEGGGEYWDGEVMFQRFSPAGAALGDSTVVAAGETPQLLWRGSEFAAAWRGHGETDEIRIRLARLTPDGGSLVELASLGSTNARRPMFSWTGSEYWVTWTDSGVPPPPGIVRRILIARVSEVGELVSEEHFTSDDGDFGIHYLNWSGSEMGLVWYEYTGWGAEYFLSRLSEDGTRIDEDFVLETTIPRAWTGSEYLTVGSTETDGVWQVVMNRIGFCE